MMHDVSPMKYLPSRKITESTRYKKNSISLGYGEKIYFKDRGLTPGPGQYKLPSVFDKSKKTGKTPMN